VFALELNREGFAKKSRGVFRRKFLIDAGAVDRFEAIHHFETIFNGDAETYRSPSELIGRHIRCRKRGGETAFGRNLGRLSVRLMSL
jgi:hypothetical protein